MHNFVSGCSEGMNSTFANHFQTKHQCVQKLLFTCVVYTNELYLLITFTKPYKNSFNWCMKLTIIYSFGGYKLSKQTIPPLTLHTQKKKKLHALIFSRMPWFQVSKISFSNRSWHNDNKKQKTTLFVLLLFCYLEWPRHNFSLQYQYNTKQTSNETKEKYKIGGYSMIHDQILQTWTL